MVDKCEDQNFSKQNKIIELLQQRNGSVDIKILYLLFKAEDPQIVKKYVTEIDLSGVEFDHLNSVCLGKVLFYADELEYIGLSNCKLSCSHLGTLAEYAKGNIPTISELYLSGNSGVVGSILSKLSNRVKELNISNCDVTVEELKSFVNSLEKNFKFRMIHFMDNPVTELHLPIIKQLMAHIDGELWIGAAAVDIVFDDNIERELINLSKEFENCQLYLDL